MRSSKVYTTERLAAPRGFFHELQPQGGLTDASGATDDADRPPLKPTMQQLIELRTPEGSASATNSC